jgi:hypothetical protein
MQFIIISTKGRKNKNEIINDDYLNSNNAPSLIAKNHVMMNISNFTIYAYLYNQIIEEKKDYSFYSDENELLLSNGFFTINNEIKENIQDIFQELNQESDIWGDYQLVHIDKEGNGFLKTPDFGLRQLFYYKDENCSVLATEIKLIVDGILNIQKQTFAENFDVDFFYDSIYNEWGTREFPKHTIFKDIQRILPFEKVYFKEGGIILNSKPNIEVPKNFKNVFNKDEFYDRYYNDLISSVESSLKFLNPTLSKIELGLTGGFDSRIAFSILYKICNEQNIAFKCFTGGSNNHPDVVIAKKIVDEFNVDYFFDDVEVKVHRPQNVFEYMGTFYSSQGDWNSNNYATFNRHINDSVLHQRGMDAYKRCNMNLIYSGTRWFARRILSSENFFFPLFFTEKEAYIALLCNNKEGCKDFIYEILKRAEPKLLEIPIVGDKLPYIDIEQYSTKYESVFHQMTPFLWDYNYVKNKLKIPLQTYINQRLGWKGKLVLRLTGLNNLDFFLNPEIMRVMREYRENKISFINTINKLKKEGQRNIYFKKEKLIETLKHDKNESLKRKMIILMDYASVADLHSFVEIEKYIDK